MNCSETMASREGGGQARRAVLQVARPNTSSSAQIPGSTALCTDHHLPWPVSPGIKQHDEGWPACHAAGSSVLVC